MEQNNHNMENKEEQHHSAQKRRVPAQRAHASAPQASHAQSGNAAGNAGHPRRRKKNSGAIITVAVIALFVILAAAVMALLFYKPTFRPDDHPLNSDDMSGVILTDASGNVVPDVVRDEERVNFLIMGRDRWAFNTDVIMLLSYDVKNGAISLMQFPRDTYFDVGRATARSMPRWRCSTIAAAVRDCRTMMPIRQPCRIWKSRLKMSSASRSTIMRS